MAPLLLTALYKIIDNNDLKVHNVRNILHWKIIKHKEVPPPSHIIT